jgi:small subunit ribosomal protein S8
MQISDTIADMLTRIRNAGSAKHEAVDIPASGLKKEIAYILLKEGYIKDVQLSDDSRQGNIRVILKYTANKKNVITGIKRISKPGLRVYAGKDDLPKVLGGLGIAIISTSHGIMTDKNARKEGVGGEVLAFVW